MFNSTNTPMQSSEAGNHPLRKNIKKNYIYILSNSIALTEAIWMLFLAHRGMNLVQIGLLESIFHVTSLAMELPTGMIADRFGRRISRISGRVMALLSTLVMLTSHSFWGFLFAFVLTAISYNLESGAGDALIYDSMLELGVENDYMKVKGRQEACFQISRMSSLVLGGFVAMYSYDLAYILTLGVHSLTIFQAFGFVEPTIGKREKCDQPSNMTLHIKESLEVIWAHKHVLRYILFIEMFSMFMTTTYFYLQNSMKYQGISEGMIGISLAIGSILGLLSSTQVHKWEKYFGPRWIIWTSSIIAIICFAWNGFTPYTVLGYLGLAFVDGMLFVTFCDYINQLIPSSHRATLLSFQAMIFSAFMIIFFPIFGAIAEHVSFETAFRLLFIIALPTMLWTLLKLDRVFRRNQESLSEKEK